MKPQIKTVLASLTNQRLIIKGKTLTFKIAQKDFNKIHLPLWQALATQAQKNKRKKQFNFELDKEELRHLHELGKILNQKKTIPTEAFNYKKAPSNLRAISIHAPYAYAICLGLKNEEYRTQSTNIRGWVLIHASLSHDSDADLKTYGLKASEIQRGCIIGAAFIKDCIGSNRDFAYLISDYRLFEKPLRISGKQAIFWKPKDAKEQQTFDKAWSMIDG